MQTTTNYGLRKPASDDFYSVEDQNFNADQIDGKMKEFEEKENTTDAALKAHTGSKSNPHGVTKAQVGLSNVPNVTTNNQTPTYAPSESNTELVSGENMTTAFGKIAKAVSSLISHLGNVANPHKVTKSQVGLGNVDNTADANKSVKYAATAGSASANDVSDWAKAASKPTYTKSEVGLGSVPNVATNDQTPTYTVPTTDYGLTSGEKLSIAFGKIAKAITDSKSHLANTSNPHSVTKAQVGLSNVPNVSTNNQTPTYSVDTSDSGLSSGEKLSAAFGKIAFAITEARSHRINVDNPHGVTKEQIGLGSVPNVSTNNQKPTYTVPSDSETLISGETLTVAMGKIARAVSNIISHVANTTMHITSSERTKWNAKLDASATAVNADKVDGYHGSDLIKYDDKPYGTYTGNGSATARSITVGGVSSAMIIWRTDAHYVALVTPKGAIKGFNVDSVGYLNSSLIYLDGTILKMATTDAAFNENGKTYHYQKL